MSKSCSISRWVFTRSRVFSWSEVKETDDLLFEDLFRQADLPALQIQIGQVAHHASTGQPQRLLPLFDPAMPHPLASLVVGKELSAQQGLRLLPERQRLVRGGRAPGL